MTLQKLQGLVHSPLSTPSGGIRGAQQPYVANALCGVAFTCNGQHSNLPGTAGVWGDTDAACVDFEGWQRTVNFTPLKTRPHTAVEGQFEGWRLTVNLSTSNTRPNRAVGPPFPPGGAGKGLGGESGGCSAGIATSLIAACAGAARASGIKVIQIPCGVTLQKLQGLVHSPPLPQPLSTPAGAERGAQQPYSANALCGVAFTCNGQHSNSPGTT